MWGDQRDIPFLSMSERVLGEMEPGFGMWDGPQSVGGPVFLIELGLPSAYVVKTPLCLAGVLSVWLGGQSKSGG